MDVADQNAKEEAAIRVWATANKGEAVLGMRKVSAAGAWEKYHLTFATPSKECIVGVDPAYGSAEARVVEHSSAIRMDPPVEMEAEMVLEAPGDLRELAREKAIAHAGGLVGAVLDFIESFQREGRR